MKKTETNSLRKKTINLSELLSLMADQFPTKPAFLYPTSITYRELEQDVNQYAHGLKRVGISRDIRTVLMVPPGPEFFTLTFALLRVGAVPVMIDPGMGAKAMANSLAKVEAVAFIGLSKAHLLRKIYPDAFKSVKICVTLGRKWFWGGYSLSDLRSDRKDRYMPYPTNPQDLAAIFFTSGSTGLPKGVVYTASMMKAQIHHFKTQFMYRPEEIDLCTFPLIGLFSICLGLTLVLADMDTMRPAALDPQKIVANIQQNGCTQMFCSPMVLNRLARYCNKMNIELSSLKRIITAGAPVSIALLRSFKQILVPGAEIHTPYGATEALPITDITATELLQQSCMDGTKREGVCVGYPMEGTDIKIVEISDDPISQWKDACQLPLNEVGEIVVKGPVVSHEYLDMPLANAIAKVKDHQDGRIWHRMGDLGRLDKEGRLWFYGRKSHRVVTPKGTLFTIPCEAIFNRHPRVFRSALVGVPIDGTNAMKPVLCIQLEPGDPGHNKGGLTRELLEIGVANPLTQSINNILYPGKFPVDARHNAKIFREKLALWAARRVK